MKLVRYGSRGNEKPGLIDADGKLRDLSKIVGDIDAETLTPKGLAAIRKRDPKRVLECLQRSLKTADACMTSAQPPISLFVEILDHYLAHLEAGNPLITPKYIAGLVALITEHVETMEAGEAREAVERHYANTRALIKARGVIELD